MPTPEALARVQIDQMLEAASWIVQDRAAMNLRAAPGVAVREFPLRTGLADYLLFVDRRAIGAVEAKPEGTPLSGIEAQAAKYGAGLPDIPPAWRRPQRFLYESTGVETNFTDGRDPEPRSRPVFAFHQPATLAAWMTAWQDDPRSLRARLRALPPLDPAGLWPAQAEAVANLEASLAAGRPRALIQMATGSGKTVTAISAIYRLIKFAGARRVLFLVDRGNLRRQAMNEFRQFVTPDDGRKFTELYNVRDLTSNLLDPVAKVCITTIQRLYSILAGEPEFDPANEEGSLFEQDEALARLPPKQVRYNPHLPIEYFDFIVTDECHRSIYNLWRQVLEYFDAFLIGLTATPSKQTLGYFDQNLVMEYSRQRAVADEVNVDGEVYRIRTAISEQGSRVDAGYFVDKRDRRTRAVRWEALDDDLVYDARLLDREVVAEDQIRTIVRTFRDRLRTEIFPGRTEVPKTLIFAKDDSHAEDIVRIVREEFGRGNDFCQKITYRVSGVPPEQLIGDFRNSYYPRVAVSVDMIATGTDIKPLEVLLFLRPVKSRLLFEQMLGRGTRVISDTDLQAVTPDAPTKDRFVIVDAVGVVEQEKVETQTLERKRSVPFDKLLEAVALGAQDDDTVSSLAGRLAKLDRLLTPEDRGALAIAAGGIPLHDITRALVDALDPEERFRAAQRLAGGADPTAGQVAAAAADLVDAALLPFSNPLLRTSLNTVQSRHLQVIDRISQDQVREAGFSAGDTARAQATVESFRQFLEAHRHEITALQILYNRPYNRQPLSFREVKELALALESPPHHWTPETLWRAYAALDPGRVRGAAAKRALTDLVALVDHAVHPEGELVPFPEQVAGRYQAWLAAQEAAGRRFTPPQHWWLDRIAAQIGVNLAIAPDDLEVGEFFNQGGRIAAARAFGPDLPALLDELNTVLAA